MQSENPEGVSFAGNGVSFIMQKFFAALAALRVPGESLRLKERRGMSYGRSLGKQAVHRLGKERHSTIEGLRTWVCWA